MRFAIFALSLGLLCCGGKESAPDSGDNQTTVLTKSCPDSSATDQQTVAVPVVPGLPQPPQELCRACGGDWSVHGIAETESCDCGTCDGGKRCTDGADCQGMCIANADNPEYEVVDSGPPVLGFLVGRCSDLVTVYGCNARVDRGARLLGPISVTEIPALLCVD